jgi:hypothetical protein
VRATDGLAAILAGDSADIEERLARRLIELTIQDAAEPFERLGQADPLAGLLRERLRHVEGLRQERLQPFAAPEGHLLPRRATFAANCVEEEEFFR